MSLNAEILKLSKRAKTSSRSLYTAKSAQKSKALLKAAELILKNKKSIKTANEKDLINGKKSGLSSAMLDRLELNDSRIKAMVTGLKDVAAQSDPVGYEYEKTVRPNKLKIKKIRVPIGTILIIYESRPNVTIDSAALCIKAGNSVILRGGKESAHSNKALVNIFRTALKHAKLPADAVQLVNTTDRKAISLLVKQTEYIDLAIPRGGEGLIKAVTEEAHIPVLKHYKGVCHIYIDKFADFKMATDISVNAKVQRPGVCNAMETLLIDKAFGKTKCVKLLNSLIENGVKILGCKETRSLVSSIKKATEKDFDTEFLNLTLSVKIVDGITGAIEHIRKFTSGHTESIVTKSSKRANQFLAEIDSSSVMWNSSTRFSDGGEYGLGAEIGISTDKIHARGPMGAYDLTTYKWIVVGTGQIRE